MVFEFGFNINRRALNLLMNEQQFKHKIYLCQFEPTGMTGCNIKAYANKPDSFVYDMLVYTDTSPEPIRQIIKKNKYLKKDKKKYVTFLVFGSSKTIISSKYLEDTEKVYNFFTQEIFKHKDLLKDII